MPQDEFATPLNDRADLMARLARAVTIDNGYLSDCPEDDIRMLQHLRPRLLGRAAHVWRPKRSEEKHFTLAVDFARRVHQQVDEDIVLQAAIFEAIFPPAGEVPIPPWVFEALDEPVESRRFDFQAMHSDLRMAPSQSPVWAPDGEVPDLTLPEARRWVIYRAGRYLDAGYEALHLGQIHLMGARDAGFEHVADLCRRIRRLAGQRGRRAGVLLDAHSHGIVRDGECLFDFTSRPLSARPRLGNADREDIILQWKAGTPGGRHPGGWDADRHPTLVEVDNWGGRTWPKEKWHDRAGRGMAGRWGRDDITWFAWQAEADRAAFLRYAHRFHRAIGPHVHFQPALTRTLGNDPQPHRPGGGHYYRANTPSPACPDGWGDEPIVAEIWQDPPPRSVEAPEPARRVALPGPVVLLGDIQSELGGVRGDTLCPFSRLEPIPGAGAICERLLVLPRPGEYRFVVATGGTGTEPLGQGLSPGGEPWVIRTRQPSEQVHIRFDYQRRTLTITPV